MKIHKDIQQGSLEWNLLRSGKVTASGADSLVTPLGKIKTGDGPKTYLMQVLAERWIGGPLPSAQGVWDLDQGQYLEEIARPAFALETNLEIEQVGCIVTDDGRASCSPDGVVRGQEIGLELKCPRLDKHLRYLLDGIVPPDYVLQLQFSLYVTGWKKWYFCSFRRNFPPLIIIVEPDEKIQAAIAEAMDTFYAQLDEAMAKMIRLNGGPPNPRHRGINPFPTPTPPAATVEDWQH